MQEIILYTKDNCPLCEEAKDILISLQKTESFQFNEVDIYSDDDLLEKFQLMIPVVEIDGEVVDFGQINLYRIQDKLG